MSVRPRIAILGRLADHTSSSPLPAVAVSRQLLESVWLAGGDPVVLLPVSDSDWKSRLAGFSGVLMPGGGDIDPTRYAPSVESDEVYGVNVFQDETDFSILEWALANGLPFLAICRGCQAVNIAFGGTLIQHMEDDHRDKLHNVSVSEPAALGLSVSTVDASCYHHQAIDRLGEGLEVVATSGDDVIEAIRIPSTGWAYGIQWHPEHTASNDKHQLEILERFIQEARAFGVA
ncbi:MAG: hypothetical protein RLZ71_60 [Actinomycetota bacterium]|jgi:putative glutamine amidotransferase